VLSLAQIHITKCLTYEKCLKDEVSLDKEKMRTNQPNRVFWRGSISLNMHAIFFEEVMHDRIELCVHEN